MSHMAASRGEESHGAWGAERRVAEIVPRAPVGKIGRVEELFVGGEEEPEYVGVRLGPFGLENALIR